MILLTKKEAEIRLGVKASTILFLMREGMPHLKIGNEYRFIEDEIVSWHKSYLPKQEKMEKEFVDSFGRKIDEYSTLEEVVSFLKMKKEKVYRLCRNGMPFEKVGKKRFFHLNDIVAYFKRGVEVSLTDIQPPKKATFIVDGSYRQSDKKGGAGIVLKEDDRIIGYSFSVEGKDNMHAEYTAIYQALKIASEKNYEKTLIATDQKTFVKTINYYNKQLPKDKWKKIQGDNTHLNDFPLLFNAMKEKVDFIYYKNLGKKEISEYKKLYNYAHHLSRVYEDGILENVDKLEKFVEEKKQEEVKKEEERKVEKKEKQTITIEEFLEKNKKREELIIQYAFSENGFPRFNVSLNGRNRVTKMNTNNTVKAALLLAHGYVYSYNNLAVTIKNIPTFEENMNNLFDPKKERMPKSMYKLFKNLEEKSDFNMENHYHSYLKNYERKLSVA